MGCEGEWGMREGGYVRGRVGMREGGYEGGWGYEGKGGGGDKE